MLIHEAVAVVHDGTRATYREPEATASGYAARLAAHGVGPGTVVPVALPRSPALVAALLAVLRCGAVYAALDPWWPRARVEAVLDLVDPPVVVGAVPGDRPTRLPPVAVSPSELSFPQVTDDAAATLFATSGTTGAPKTVLSPHRATTRLCRAGPLAFGPGWAMPQAAALPWDATTLELWGMLATDGTAVLTDGGYFLPDRLADLVRTAGVNAVRLTSSVFNLSGGIPLGTPVPGTEVLVCDGDTVLPPVSYRVEGPSRARRTSSGSRPTRAPPGQRPVESVRRPARCHPGHCAGAGSTPHTRTPLTYRVTVCVSW